MQITYFYFRSKDECMSGTLISSVGLCRCVSVLVHKSKQNSCVVRPAQMTYASRLSEGKSKGKERVYNHTGPGVANHPNNDPASTGA